MRATREEVNGSQIGKKVKLSLFADDICKNPKDSTKKTKNRINEFSNVDILNQYTQNCYVSSH